TGTIDSGPLGPDGRPAGSAAPSSAAGAGTGASTSAQPGTPAAANSGSDKSQDQDGIGTQVFALCSGSQETPSPRLLRLMTRLEFQNTLGDLLNTQKPDVSNLPLEPRVRGYDNNAAASVVTSRHLDEYQNVLQPLIDQAVSQQKGALVTCQQTAPDCPSTVVQKFGLRAFRRPLTSDETSRYAALFASDLTGGDFDQGLKLALTSMLISPNFLYRSEVGEKRADGTYQLTQYEIASALSYLYWGSMPDQTLFDAASKNQLSTQDQLEAQARRLLQDNRAQAQFGEFSLQWLGSDSLETAFKDTTIYPSFNDGVRTAMLEEQRRFMTDVALARDGKFSELYLADYVFANGDLARFYGLNPAGNDYAKVTVTPDSQRGGLLGLGAVLASQAHSNESSPVKRGKFVRDRLLCQDLPPPPVNLDTTPPGLDPTLTTRARFAKHTADPACSSCHKFIDGVGFGFEGFDGVGQKRTQENGQPIDTTGTLLGREGLSQNTSETFHGPRDLAALLANSPSAQSCFTLQYFRFARGYEETMSDACSLEKLKSNFEAKDLTVKELLVNIALLDSFTVRRAQ
ncbi:MAG TPA: DUF1592 domain-containing protein, partial [Polyangiaceae bacterium]|nr:DUF1592 domain-containing protein [Polyangiaceae bacterium]